MNSPTANGRLHFAGYRIGDTYCLSPSTAIIAVDRVPKDLNQIPGTKPWLMGAGRLDRHLVPFINISRFLNIPRSNDQQAMTASALFVRGDDAVGSIAVVVDELIEFIPASELLDHSQADFRIPPGLGKSMRQTVKARDRVWALIDLKALISDDQIKSVDLT